MFLGNINSEELIEWINELKEYFDYKEIEDPNKIKIKNTRLKGHGKI